MSSDLPPEPYVSRREAKRRAAEAFNKERDERLSEIVHFVLIGRFTDATQAKMKGAK